MNINFNKIWNKVIISILIPSLFIVLCTPLVINVYAHEINTSSLNSAQISYVNSVMQIEDGMTKPILDVSDCMEDGYTNADSEVLRFVVYIETDYDSDIDGKRDLVKALVQVPRRAANGEYKAPVIYEASPYLSGCNITNFPANKDEPFREELLYDSPNKRDVLGTSNTLEQSARAVQSDWKFTFNESSDNENPAVYMSFINSYDYYLSCGYAVVLSSGLGTYGSEGLECCASRLEQEAFKCIVEWLHGDRVAFTDKENNIAINADWSSGKVGMRGFSYSAAMAYEVADTGVEGLETIVIGSGPYSWYDYANSQGILCNGNQYAYTSYLSKYCASRLFKDFPETVYYLYGRYLGDVYLKANELRGSYGDIWEKYDYYSTSSNCKADVLLTHGLNDDNVTSKQFDLARNRLKKAGCNVKTILHQGGHVEPMPLFYDEPRIYEDYTYDELINIWLAHYLLDVDNQIEVIPDMMWQSNLSGEYVKIDEWDTGENRYMLPNNNDLDVVNAAGSYSTSREIYDYTLIGQKTDGSAYWSYYINEPVTINGKIPVKLRIKTDFVGDYDLPLSVYLVDSCDESFDAFSPCPRTSADLLEASQPGMLPAEGMALDRLATNRKVVSIGKLNLNNPNSDYEPSTATKPDTPIVSGEYYDYTVYLSPKYYTFLPGHRIELYITTFGDVEPTVEGADIDDHIKLTDEYSFTIDNSVSYCLLPVTYDSGQLYDFASDSKVVSVNTVENVKVPKVPKTDTKGFPGKLIEMLLT